MAYLLVFGIIVAFTLATASLYRYGNVQRQHILVTLSVLIAWSFSFMIVFTIPLDVTNVNIDYENYNFTYDLCHWPNISFFSLRRCIANVYTKKMTHSKCSLAQNPQGTQRMIAKSHGEWYPMMYFQVYGDSFIGHRSF